MVEAMDLQMFEDLRLQRLRNAAEDLEQRQDDDGTYTAIEEEVAGQSAVHGSRAAYGQDARNFQQPMHRNGHRKGSRANHQARGTHQSSTQAANQHLYEGNHGRFDDNAAHPPYHQTIAQAGHHQQVACRPYAAVGDSYAAQAFQQPFPQRAHQAEFGGHAGIDEAGLRRNYHQPYVQTNMHQPNYAANYMTFDDNRAPHKLQQPSCPQDFQPDFGGIYRPQAATTMDDAAIRLALQQAGAQTAQQRNVAGNYQSVVSGAFRSMEHGVSYQGGLSTHAPAPMPLSLSMSIPLPQPHAAGGTVAPPHMAAPVAVDAYQAGRVAVPPPMPAAQPLPPWIPPPPCQGEPGQQEAYRQQDMTDAHGGERGLGIQSGSDQFNMQWPGGAGNGANGNLWEKTGGTSEAGWRPELGPCSSATAAVAAGDPRWNNAAQPGKGDAWNWTAQPSNTGWWREEASPSWNPESQGWTQRACESWQPDSQGGTQQVGGWR